MKDDSILGGAMVKERITTQREMRRISRAAEVPIKRTGPEELMRDLNEWLSHHADWDHQQWLDLLSDLRLKGYSDLIDTSKGQAVIGLYLERNRTQPF